ncbi:helix-turn-helix domain-containing protein [Niallia sp. NCCP-28]|uniref:response regulator transcription factor n=1 Tax=Niallia sp. NCCP-28 TaxID=2934712 RepID=UPI002084783E|nr:helix-turn-helix domain-containing protein [Niallia sp. NCCP-28]GKU81902.1 DNA-binding response regulator [Niallia sp. NCCP-28]
MERVKTVIVDDEPKILNRLIRIVQSCGDEWEIVGTFSDGKEAYDGIKQGFLSFDLLLTDVQMPEMNGLELVHSLKDDGWEFEAIIISGYDQFSYLQTAMRQGVSNYLLKPINKTQMAAELGGIREKIEKKRAEQKEIKNLEHKASELNYAKQVQFLTQSQVYMAEPNEKEWVYLFGDKRYQLLYLSIDQNIKQSLSKDLKRWIRSVNQEVEAILRSCLSNFAASAQADTWLWKEDLFSFWLLVAVSQEGEILSITEELVHLIRDKAKKEAGNTISMAIGESFFALDKFIENKKRLEELMQNRIVYGSNKVFWLEKLEREEGKYVKSIGNDLVKDVQQIIYSLENGTKQQLAETLEQYFKNLHHLKSARFIEEAVQLLGIRMMNRWIELDAFREKRELFQEVLTLTKNTANFYQLTDKIKNWVFTVRELINQVKEDETDPIHKAKMYIEEHLGESITIKIIAQHVYMSPTYFSHYFKEQTGETVLDYITKCRLKKAREMLETTDAKIYDISFLLGYQDTKYFSRLFRQWYGYSPSQYRENFNKTYNENKSK